MLEARPDPAQNYDVDECDHHQENRRHRSADYAARRAESFETTLHRSGAERDCRGRQHDNGGVTEREGKPSRQRPFVLVHQLADDIVDGRNMVGIDGVPEPEDVGQ
jgi:hypothetical protein